MSGINNMNQWEDSWKALHEQILRHERTACQRRVVKEFNNCQSIVESYQVHYQRHRKSIDKDIARLKRSYFREKHANLKTEQKN